MNAQELQQRLDALASPQGSASEGEWTRNQELVGARRRRPRWTGAGVTTGVAAAAALAVVLLWHPPADTVRVVPAAPTTTAPRESDFDAHAVDPASKAALVRQCGAFVGAAEGGYTAVFAAHSGVGDSVTVRVGATGQLQFCTAWAGEGVSESMPLTLRADDGSPNRGMLVSRIDGFGAVSVLGFEPIPYDRVVVTSADGQEHEAVMADGYWWTPMPDDGRDSQISWLAYDADGLQIDQGVTYSVPLVPLPDARESSTPATPR